jgi:hypothetical protein
VCLITLSKKGPIPVYQYLDYIYEEDRIIIDDKKIEYLMKREEIGEAEKFLIDYQKIVPEKGSLSVLPLSRAIEKMIDFLAPI